MPACNHVIDDLSCNILHVYIFTLLPGADPGCEVTYLLYSW